VFSAPFQEIVSGSDLLRFTGATPVLSVSARIRGLDSRRTIQEILVRNFGYQDGAGHSISGGREGADGVFCVGSDPVMLRGVVGGLYSFTFE